MELPGSGYLYTLAILAMTFAGFCAIVLVLRESMGRKVSRHSHLRILHHVELGLTSAAAAMLAPLLAACGLSASLAWRWASAIIAIGLVVHNWYILKRFIALGRFPIRVWFNTTITGLVILSLLANSAGFPFEPGPGPIVVAATWRLVMGATIFMLIFEDFLERAARR